MTEEYLSENKKMVDNLYNIMSSKTFRNWYENRFLVHITDPVSADLGVDEIKEELETMFIKGKRVKGY